MSRGLSCSEIDLTRVARFFLIQDFVFFDTTLPKTWFKKCKQTIISIVLVETGPCKDLYDLVKLCNTRSGSSIIFSTKRRSTADIYLFIFLLFLCRRITRKWTQTTTEMESVRRKLLSNPRDTASSLSVLLFIWTIDLFKKGYQRTLQLTDLYETLPEDRSTNLGDQLER